MFGFVVGRLLQGKCGFVVGGLLGFVVGGLLQGKCWDLSMEDCCKLNADLSLEDCCTVNVGICRWRTVAW